MDSESIRYLSISDSIKFIIVEVGNKITFDHLLLKMYNSRLHENRIDYSK